MKEKLYPGKKEQVLKRLSKINGKYDSHGLKVRPTLKKKKLNLLNLRENYASNNIYQNSPRSDEVNFQNNISAI